MDSGPWILFSTDETEIRFGPQHPSPLLVRSTPLQNGAGVFIVYTEYHPQL